MPPCESAPRHRRARLAGLSAFVLAGLALGACGGGSAPHVSAGQNPTTSAPASSAAPATTAPATSVPVSTTAPVPSTTVPTSPAAPATTVKPGFKVVRYGAVAFQVPSDWPVYDLSKNPRQCVRYDVHAVYLGHEGSDPDCPARVVGHVETVQVEPLDAKSQTTAARATQGTTVNGQPAQIDPSSASTGALVTRFDGMGVVVTATVQSSDALGQQIVQTFTPAP